MKENLEKSLKKDELLFKIIKNNLRNLLQTNEGERFFQPNLGLNLRRLLFEQITQENLINIQNAIMDKFDFWLPFWMATMEIIR